MRLHVPDSLLTLLRDRREEQRQNERAPTFFASVRRLFTAAPSSLIATMKGVIALSAPDTTKRAALRYVDGMSQMQREVEDKHDAFLLDPGMGPMLFITADGRVLTDGRSWDGEELREATDDEAVGALVVGAKKTKIQALLALIPSASDGGLTCPMCDGRRSAEPVAGFGHELVCLLCMGRGWVTVATLDAAKAKGVWPRSQR